MLRTISHLTKHLSASVALATLAVCLLGAVGANAQGISFVQANAAVPQSPQATVAVTFSAAQIAGSLNVVVVGWNDASSVVQTVVDSKGHTYVRAVGPTVRAGFATQSIYYAKNIQASTAGSNTVTVTFNQPATYVDLRIAEYRGLDPNNPVDVVAAATGSSSSTNSSSVTTTNANDLLVGANLVATRTTAAGSGYTSRLITVPDGDIIEDRIVTAIGSYNAVAPVSPSGQWIMQMVAFRAASVNPDTQAPTAPASLITTAVSGTQINLSWTASTDNIGVTNYLIERCQNAGCSTFAQVATSATTTFSNTGLTTATSYSYRVRATDAASNLSGFSNTSTAVTPDTQAPTAPASLTTTAVSGTQINLSWTASTDNVGVTNYLIERCQNAGCSTFAQVATSATTTFSNTGLTTATSYSYRVRATDAASNLSGFSNTSTAVTPDTQAPTAPAGLTTTAVSSTQINLSWTAATDNVGVTNYLIERCQNVGCSTFAQVATSATTTFSNTGLTTATSYSYRVRATDAASNLSGFSNTSTAVTPDTQAPTAPAGLTTTAVSSTQINLSWTASTDNVGVTNYLIERCQSAGCSTFAQVATSASTTFNDTGLTGSTSYSYRVRATDAANNLSGFSNTSSATTQAAPDTQAPTAPAGLTTTAVSSTQINLSWTASTDNVGVTNYLIERCQSAGCSTFAQVATSASTTFNDTGLTGSTSYSYRVRATDAANNLSGFSNTSSATTQAAPDTQAPTAPAGLTTTAVSSTQINLSWTASTDNVGVTNYLIERCQSAGCSTFAQVATSASTTFNDTGLTGSTSYSYRVRATDAANNLSGFSNTSSATTQAAPDTQAPTAPAGLTTTAVSSTQINLSWTASTDNVGVTNYLIERCQSAGCSTFAQVATSASTTFNDTGLTGSTSYSYRVRATDAANNLSGFSNTSSATTQAAPDTQAPTAPAGLTTTAVSSTQINLSWTASTDNVGVTNYLIERCQSAGCSTFAQVATSASTTFNDTGLTGSTSYSYRVRATDAANNLSGFSNTSSATTQAAPDTQPPTAPAGLTTTAVSSTQINLSWTASTDNVGVTNYLIESCQNAGCSTFAQVATSASTSFNDTGLTAATSYSYRVRATDAANNLSGFSNTSSATTQAAPDTQPPTAPAGLTTTAVSSSQINLGWTASTDNVGVTNYLIERCQNAGCSTFAQVATSASTTFNDTGLIGSTSYSYRVRATDAADNQSGFSNTSSATTLAAPAIAFAQANFATPQSPQSTVAVLYTLAQAAGNLNVVVVGWNDSSGQVQSVTDTRGNAYVLAVGPTVYGGFATQSIYYSANIAASSAGGNTVTVVFNGAVNYADIRIAEYSGITSTNPVDGVAAAQGNGVLGDSGAITTTNPTDLIIGANIVSSTTTGPGASFTSRVITIPDGDILEDRLVTAAGSYSATAPMDSGSWIMQLVAFKGGTPVSDTQPPSTVTGLNSTPISGTQINLSWNASTDNVGVTNYLIERCQNAGCSTFAQVATSATTTFSNTGLTTATSYSYRVRATDAASNLSGFSNTSTAVTPDTQAPTAPAGLITTAVSSTQINLSWTAATDNVGVTNYLIERCQNVGCSTFAQVATSATTTFSNTGLTTATSYSYRVRATDAASNLSGFSNTSTAVTPDTQAPTAPAGLTTTAVSNTQINLSWTAATDNVGVTNYLIERCQSAGCSTFAQVATSASTTFNDTGLTGSTSYSYRVQATDAASNLSGFSNTSSATTPAAPDTQAPTAPAGLTTTAVSSTQINLGWTASTDNVGVTNYLIERCQSAGCSTFAQVATSASTTFNDTGLTGSTSYSYRVRATDAASNLSGFSNTSSATTQAAPDTQPPTAPAGLTTTAVSSSQINLGWTASTDNVGVTNYLIERCQSAGCSTFAQVATSASTTFNDTGLTASTSYSYRVQATDAASNLSGFSNTSSATTQAVPDTQPPTAPAGLTTTAVSSTQINLGWTASTDNVGVTNYLIERCQNAGCSTFAQVATSASTTFNDTGLIVSTSYSYRVRATDAANNLSGFSNTSSATTLAAPAIAFSQANFAAPQAPQSTVAVPYTLAQAAGNLNVVVVGWNDASGQVQSVTDTRGNTYVLAVGPTVYGGFATQSIYYSANIAASSAGGNTVTVVFNGAVNYADIRIAEYSGIASTNPVDGVAAAQGNGVLGDSGAITTTNPTDLIIGANIVSSTTTGPGTLFTSRVISVPDGDILEDRFVTAAGSYNATAPMASGSWIMQMVAFKGGTPAADTQAPTAPSSLTTTAISSTQINLSWTASTDNVGVTNYLIERCQGAGCSTFAQVATSASTTFNDTGLTVSTSYSYRVRATDAAGNLSGFSNTSAAATLSPDTQAPTAPSSLTSTPISGTQINLGWTASTDNVGVTNYLIERCQNAGCSTFAQVATSASTTFDDTGLTPSTSYSYRVRATDAAGNLSGFSNTAQATTLSPDTEPPSAPGVLTATPVSGTQIDVAWGPATDNVGVTGYRLERCQGVGCTAFTKIGTTLTGTTFSDIGLTLNASYSYIIRAQDAAGNLGPYSNTATATTLGTNPQLVAAYAFEEGAGSVVNDFSGHGNNGTITNATWTVNGKFGKALSFNGSDALVTIPDSATVRLTTGMTLEAWVNRSAGNSGWRDIIYKGDDNYYLEASNTNGVPVIGIKVGATQTEAFGLQTLPLGSWTFLAATYDGSTLRFYVDGTQVSSQARSGAIVTSGNPLQIGGDSIYGQHFAGLIDEIRIYNVALTPGQIQADMVTALGSSSPAFSPSTTSVNFGNQSTGTSSSPQAITVTNGGNATLAITGVTITGAHAADFVQTNNCVGSIAPSASCTINVTFTPSNAGVRNGTLSVANNAPGNPHAITLTGTGVGFSITPVTSVLTPPRTQQFTVSGTGGSPVLWSVDSVVGGTAGTGTITSSGLYTPPSGAGVHSITVATTDGTKSATGTAYITTQAGMFTHHNNNARTGLNSNETVLSLSNVNSSTFGKLTTFTTDGIAHAAPLYVSNVNIPGVGLRNVVYVATEHDSVYAFDADGGSTTPLWHVSFINPGAGITTVPNGDTGECCDITPEIGITGTPVIDPATGTLYVVAKTKESPTSYPTRLHALDIATGAEKLGGPVLIQATVPGTGTGSSGGQLSFNSLRENARTAILLLNGVVYFGFGSHGDYQPYHGWLFGYNATTLQRVLAFNTTPNGEGGGIWQSGAGLVVDSAGNLFFATGDGTFNANSGGVDYGDSFLRFNPVTGVVSDYFTPHDEGSIDASNLDLNAGGMILLPDQPGPHPHLLVSAGKNGTVYLVDRDNMTHFHTTDQNPQTLANVFPFGTPLPGNYSSPAYFNGSVYFAPVADVVQEFRLTNGLLSTAPVSTTAQIFQYPGAALSVSSNGVSNGIVWAVQKNGSSAGALRAYAASNLATELYNSNQAGSRDTLDVAAKFSIPLVINGKVYVATEGQLAIYGLLP